MTLYRRAWRMQLKPGAEAEYDAAHAAIWPELTQQMLTDGIASFHLYREGQTVFAVQERTRPFDATASKPSALTRRWWNDMAELMVTGEDNRPLQTELREVFSLTGAQSKKDGAA